MKDEGLESRGGRARRRECRHGQDGSVRVRQGYVPQSTFVGNSRGQFMNEIRNQANRRPSCFETCDLLGAPRIYEILGALGRPETAGGVEGVRATAIAAH